MKRLANRVTRLEADSGAERFEDSPLKPWLKWMSSREMRRLLAILQPQTEQARNAEAGLTRAPTDADRCTMKLIFERAEARKKANWLPPKGPDYRNEHRWRDYWPLECRMRHLESGASRSVFPAMDDLDWLTDTELDRLEVIVKKLDRTSPWNAAALPEIESIKHSGQVRCRMGEWPMRAWEAIHPL